MKNLNNYKNHPRNQVVSWVLPTAVEIFIYVILAAMTIVALNSDFIRSYLLIPDSFSLQTALLGSLEDYLADLIGTKMAATVITGTFWALVGVIVYAVLRIFGNFSSELSNDLVVTKYMHPQGDDTYYPLKRLLLRVVFHILMAILVVVYINLFIGQFLPYLSGSLAGISVNWNDIPSLLEIAKIVLIEIAALHLFVILTRLLVLRRRVFGFGM